MMRQYVNNNLMVEAANDKRVNIDGMSNSDKFDLIEVIEQHDKTYAELEQQDMEIENDVTVLWQYLNGNGFIDTINDLFNKNLISEYSTDIDVEGEIEGLYEVQKSLSEAAPIVEMINIRLIKQILDK